MKRAIVEITGTRPFLHHKLPIEGFGERRKEKTGTAGNDPNEWRKTYRATKDNQLFMPHEMVFGCLREAAKFTKRGRGSIVKYVVATLQILGNEILFDRYLPEEDPNHNEYDDLIYIDVRRVKNPNTRGSANIRYRLAMSPGWKSKFEIEWDQTIVSENEMEAVMIDAGTLVGVGDGRAIGMGRFMVDEFNVQETT